MKGIMVILVLLAAGMLVFGCTYSAQSSANYSTGGSNETSGATQPSGAASGGSNPPPTGSNATGSGTPAATEPAITPSPELSGKDYSDLVGMGSASRCAVAYTDDTGNPATLDIYFSGNNKMRMEQQTKFADCPSAVMVYKGDSSGNGMLYLTCPGHEEEALGLKFATHEVCQWQTMEIEQQWGGIGTSSLGIGGGYMTPSLEYLTEPVYSCQSWTLDASKFETPGFVCD